MTPDPPQQPHAAGPRSGASGTPILEQHFDAGSLYSLRATVAAHATQAGIPERRTSDIVLAMHELAANAIRHGAGHGWLLITERAGAWHCQVTDDGTPHATPAGPAPGTQTTRRDAPWPSEEGHGLWLVHQVADQLDTQTGPGGTTITASFNLPQTSQQQQSPPPPPPPTAPGQDQPI
jgi:anti-sigma regulatory factor (Ser/Thr protein kinase)